MSLSVKFNGYELNNYINVLSGFTPFTGIVREVNLNNDANIIKGAKFLFATYKEKKIKMPFEINGDVEARYNILQKILNVSEPKQLILGNVPDKYFLAIPSGDLDFEEIAMFGAGTVEWVIPDGLAHSTVEKVFNASSSSNGVLKTIIKNEGTEAVPIDYTITHKHENGYIGIVSPYGAIQLGKVEEPDGEVYERSESRIVVSDGQMTSTELNGWTKNVAVLLPVGTTISQEGTLVSRQTSTVNGKKENVINLSSRGSGSGKWKGASMTKVIGADSEGKDTAKHFLAVMKHAMMLGTPYQVGITQFLITTKDKKNLAGICFVKNNQSDLCEVQFWVNGKKMGSTITSVNAYTQRNPYLNWNVGHHSITKSGSSFTFYFGTKKYTYSVKEAANMEAYEVSYAMFALDGYDQITVQAIRGIHFRKDKVEKYRDIPNRYPAGSVVQIDGSSTKVYVDKEIAHGDEILGSKYFLAPPGETEIQFYHSTFSDPPPVITAKIREAWL